MKDQYNSPVKLDEEKLHNLIYTLLYPAVLGAMFVGLVIAFTENRLHIEFRFFFALFLLLYFSSQHVENLPKPTDHYARVFILELIEVGLIFALSLILGIFKFHYSIPAKHPNAWTLFYLLLFAALLLPVVSRIIQGTFRAAITPPELGKTLLSCLAAVVALVGLYINQSIALLVTLYTLLLIYLCACVLPKQ